jgi:hypothetical protein
MLLFTFLSRDENMISDQVAGCCSQIIPCKRATGPKNTWQMRHTPAGGTAFEGIPLMKASALNDKEKNK